MRIAVISRVFSKTGGGAESYSVALVQQLATRHEIHVFSQESNQPVAGATYHPVFCLSQKPRWINQILFALLTWLKTRSGFDVVHSHENTWHGQIQTIHVRPIRYNLFFARRGFGLLLRWIKVVTSPRLITYVLMEGARFKISPDRRTVSTSDNLRIECEQAYPHNIGRIPVITPGTHLNLQTMNKLAARKTLNLPPGEQLVLFVANDYAKKGLDTLLRAMVLVNPDTNLVVIGSPGAMPKYTLMAKKLRLDGRIHFLGSLNDLSAAYCAADCLAHPTLEDSFAMVVLEAMAHKLPVIVSSAKYCGISQLLAHGVDALLLQDPKDPKELAQFLSLALANSRNMESMTQAGLEFAKRHSWAQSALQYEILYGEVCAG